MTDENSLRRELREMTVERNSLCRELQGVRRELQSVQHDLATERRANARLRDQRRDMFAGFAMAGLLAGGWNIHDVDEGSGVAERFADGLVARLDKEGGSDGE